MKMFNNLIRKFLSMIIIEIFIQISFIICEYYLKKLHLHSLTNGGCSSAG